jgi:hypothetical protein
MRGRRCGLSMLALVLLLPLDACFPTSWPATPTIDARVIDAASLQPIAGALVTVWSTDDPKRRIAAKTDSDGRVLLPQQERTMWLPPLPIDPAWPASRLRWEADGYDAREQDTLGVLFKNAGAGGLEPRPLPVTLSLTRSPPPSSNQVP